MLERQDSSLVWIGHPDWGRQRGGSKKSRRLFYLRARLGFRCLPERLVNCNDFMKSHLIAVLALISTALNLAAQPANSPRRDFWTADGAIFSMLNTNGVIYLAGTFTVIGYGVAGGTTLTADQGAPDLEIPPVSGTVNAVVSDGAGGWIIGGNFTGVGGTARANLAHIRPDRTLNPAFNPNISGPVLTLTRVGNVLYVGGSFTRIGAGLAGSARTNVAAINAVSGAVLPWSPNPNGVVRAIATFGSRVFVGGSYTLISGESRTNLAALDAVSGSVTDWDPRVEGRVNALQYVDDELIVGGSFSNISGVPRQNLAKVDPFSDTVSAWAPNPDGPVNAVLKLDRRVYVGGSFTNISGAVRRNFSSLDPVTGANGFDFLVDGEVRTISANASRIYVGGAFSRFGGNNRSNAAALDRINDNLIGEWSSEIGDAVNAIAADTRVIYVGGAFVSLGGQRRLGLAALDEVSGQILPWNPSLSVEGTNDTRGQAFTLAYSDQRIFAGGEFTRVGTEPRTNLVAVHATTGEVLPWTPNPNGGVEAVLISGERLFVGGSFQNVGGLARTNLAAVELATGKPTDFNPSPDNSVLALAASDQVLYVGGSFLKLGGRNRARIGAINLATGAVTPWDPFASTGEIHAFALDAANNRIFVGGSFASIGSQFRTNLVALDLRTGQATTNWITPTDRTVDMLTIINGNLFVGGQFSSLNGLSRNRLGGLNLTNASDIGWVPSFNNQVFALTVTAGGSYYVGGSFTTASGFSQQGLAVFPPFGVASLAGSIQGTNQFQLRLNANAGEKHIIQGSTNMIDWVSIATNSAGLPVFTLNFTLSPAPANRFFRAFVARQ